MVNPEAYYDDEPGPMAVDPTGGSAHSWAPMSFNPYTGLIYIPASYESFTYQAADEYKKGSTGTSFFSNTKPRQIKAAAIGPEAPDRARGGCRRGSRCSISLVWRADGRGIGGGTVTTGGNRVFQTSSDGRFAVRHGIGT